MSGFMALTGERDGPPTKVGESIGDLSAGLFCSWAILAALYERSRTGCGRQIDVGMVDALISLLPTAVAQWMFGDSPPSRTGNRHPISTPFGAYPTSDGYIVICVLSAAHFAQLMACIGRPDLSRDPRYATDEMRTRHETELSSLLVGWLRTLTVTEALRRLHDAGVPASRIENPDEVFASNYVRERSILSTTTHPVLGAIPAMEQPVHFAGLARGRQRAAPALDEHHAAVLERWLGAVGAAGEHT
jgi:CoA:oxalate CoA-transferase